MRQVESFDFNLLVALDALLREQSVTGAARRLHLSPPAMSRTLSRIRAVLGDPILVRAGQRLVPTPLAVDLQPRVRAAVEEARALLRREAGFMPAALRRTFVIRTNDVLAGGFAAAILALARREAPMVRLCFVPEGEEDVVALRDGQIDLDIGVVGETGPEVRVQHLFRDRMVGAVRVGHPLTRGPITARRFAAGRHISVSRRGRLRGPIDQALGARGLQREVELAVPSFYSALFVAAASDLIATVPARLAASAAASCGVQAFRLPVETPAFEVVQTWHPRHDADPSHRWLRGLVRQACGGRAPATRR